MAELGKIIQLTNQQVEVVKCETCGALMANIDAKELKPGDLKTLKLAGVHISNPDTTDPICLECDVEEHPSFREKVNDYYNRDNDDDDDDNDDSSLFHGGGSFGGGFGGFGGGSFGGGGASRSF